MKSPGLSTCVWLLAIGAAATLLIGAFVRFDLSSAAKPGPPPPLLAIANQGDVPDPVAEPTLPADLSPGLAEVIRLAQAHVGDGVILAFIQNSGQTYTPSAEEILYLSDLGLPQNVIAALFKDKPPAALPDRPAIAAAPPAVPEPEASAPAPPPATSDSSYFYNDLAPYGSWVQAPDYGLSWQPTVQTIDADWSPYLDHGQWLDSDCGWYWQSDYTWGWAAFHYGRWVRAPHLGWVWVPGSVWAPAWVAWRSTGTYYGWAPLPPGASLSTLAAATALPPSSFVFVNAENFLNRDLRGRAVPAPRAASLFAQSAPVGSYSIVNNKIINGGISREAVAAATHKTLKPIALRSVSSPTAAPSVADRSTLPVYRPDASSTAGAAWSQSSAFLLNKPAAKPAATPPPAQAEPEFLANAFPDESSLLLASPEPEEPDVQLPPLRPGAAPPWPVKTLAYAVSPGNALAPRPVHHRGSGRLDPVERPATPAPRGEMAPPPRIEAGPPSAEPRRAGEPPRLPQPEAAQTASQPVSVRSTSSGNSAASTHR